MSGDGEGKYAGELLEYQRTMRHFRDTIFCPFWRRCQAGAMCPRAYTDEVEGAAKTLLLPVAHYATYPCCFIAPFFWRCYSRWGFDLFVTRRGFEVSRPSCLKLDGWRVFQVSWWLPYFRIYRTGGSTHT